MGAVGVADLHVRAITTASAATLGWNARPLETTSWKLPKGTYRGWVFMLQGFWAQTRGTPAAIAALRETSIIFGAVIGALVFHERFGPKRATAAAVVVAGIVLITTG
ncbi:drug/metabolite transporter (DMT)-like permease [Kribbella aluminosa]|uniref:Drug/metabolite transporter (DMT)-like permease n=1 Tax=Kribbella aluminosa TaxID=416017 RepID=A0ABS4UPM2_9ACTN|nr:EamA family transporter [Kribbella aluminosa]MBP2353585.1 drug/metabolite transporter (DMT)-like permease [Kribbella aluminosa]